MDVGIAFKKIWSFISGAGLVGLWAIYHSPKGSASMWISGHFLQWNNVLLHDWFDLLHGICK
jgi:hypothetical protein